MSNDTGNILIGVGVLLTTITAILFKIKFIRNKCASCMVTEKSINDDIENAQKVANEVTTIVPRAIWCNMGEIIKKHLTPNQIKEAEIVLETIEEIGESSLKK
jgi:hypothetical protein